MQNFYVIQSFLKVLSQGFQTSFLAYCNFFTAVCGRFRQAFLNLGDQTKWQLIALDRWSSYTVETVWEVS